MRPPPQIKGTRVSQYFEIICHLLLKVDGDFRDSLYVCMNDECRKWSIDVRTPYSLFILLLFNFHLL